MGKGNPFVAVRLTPDQLEVLRARASGSGQTVSEIVREAIVRYAADGLPARPRRPRRESRPARLARIANEVADLLKDYMDWQDSLPDSLQESTTAAMLADTIDRLEEVQDALMGVDPPRGFGRDKELLLPSGAV